MSAAPATAPLEIAESQPAKIDGSWRVLLFNDQVHTFQEVILLLVLATGFDLKRCVEITEQAHVTGRAEVIRADEATAEKVAKVLIDGGLIAAVRPV